MYAFRMQTNDSPSVAATRPGSRTSPLAAPASGRSTWRTRRCRRERLTYNARKSGLPAGGLRSVGRTGRFTFSSSPDVASFRWGCSDPPGDVLTPVGRRQRDAGLDPDGGGAKTLYVQAVDRAGRTARRRYRSPSRPRPPPWPAGSSTTPRVRPSSSTTPATGVTRRHTVARPRCGWPAAARPRRRLPDRGRFRWVDDAVGGRSGGAGHEPQLLGGGLGSGR